MTQLFTPDWIVRYMVENSLGRLWVEGHPDCGLKENWKYYLEEAQQEPEVQAKLSEIRKEYAALNPEDIKLIDPCMGSGHILVYAFDVLMQIYESAGYSQRDATKSILEHNIYGLDIDDRAYQLAYFAVMMKARQYNRRILNGENTCHVYAIQESNSINLAHLKYFGAGMDDIEKNAAKMQLEGLLDTLTDAKEYGSILNVDACDWDLLRRFVEQSGEDEQMSMDSFGLEDTKEHLRVLIDIGQTMAQKYEIAVTNPPYMSSASMTAKLTDYVRTMYPGSKSDLFAVLIEKCSKMVKSNCMQAMITQHSWMFLTSFEKLRENFLIKDMVNMIHLGARAFEEIGGEVVQTTSFVIRNAYLKNYKGTYCRLIEPTTQQGKEDAFLSKEGRFSISQENFAKIPGKPYAYWVSDSFVEAFNNKRLGDIAYPKTGFTTGNNDDFLRLWFEVSDNKIQSKWFYLNKGGAYRKWYGNNEYVVDWENDGLRIRNNKGSTIRNPDYYFRRGATWSKITSYKLSGRFSPETHIFDAVGLTCFTDESIDLYFVLALFCSEVSSYFLSVLNPTLSMTTGAVANLPVRYSTDTAETIHPIVEENISISKADWDAFETSWDFEQHPLVRWSKGLWDGTSTAATMHHYYGKLPKVNCLLELCYLLWQGECNERFNQLKANEEELNRIFIDIYGLQDELAPEVEDKDVTVCKADLQRDIKSLLSYAVGCMFGRYSLDIEGLAYAGGDWDENQYKTFLPDADAIIPITDEEYLGDDIVTRLCSWLSAVYGKETLEENLDFIAKALGSKGSSREIIRSYFLKDFFKDHCKIYQKRPIYWLFDSGKQNGFKALVYLHRYTPDTIGNLRIDYLHKIQRVYESEINRMQDMMDHSGNAREVAVSTKRKEKLQKQLKECRDYDEKIAHLALSRIELDLDDGVKVNYEKIQTASDGKKYPVLAKI